MVGDQVQVTITLDKQNPYHREALRALQSCRTPGEAREFLCSAVLYYSRSPSYQLQSGIEQGVKALRELSASSTESMKQYVRYMQELVESVQVHEGAKPAPIVDIEQALRRVLEAAPLAVGSPSYNKMLSDMAQKFDRIWGALEGRDFTQSAERVLSTGNEGKPEEGYGKIKDDGKGQTFKDLADQFGG